MRCCCDAVNFHKNIHKRHPHNIRPRYKSTRLYKIGSCIYIPQGHFSCSKSWYNEESPHANFTASRFHHTCHRNALSPVKLETMEDVVHVHSSNSVCSFVVWMSHPANKNSSLGINQHVIETTMHLTLIKETWFVCFLAQALSAPVWCIYAIIKPWTTQLYSKT